MVYRIYKKIDNNSDFAITIHYALKRGTFENSVRFAMVVHVISIR